MSELNFSSGDYVRFRLADKELDATVLDSLDSSVVLIKLENGYNIGLNKENILSFRIIRKFQKKDCEETIKDNIKKDKPSLGLIVTGGTIASKFDQKTGGVNTINTLSDFKKFYPELFDNYNILKIEVPFMIFSENMSSENWKQIAFVAESMLNDSRIDGIIVTHGTDTLHYTASALSFFLRDLNKPVVLSYAQKSIDRASSDARLNILCAAKMASSDCAEVVIVGHSSINDDYCFALRGTKVRKMHSSRRDAFKSINESPIAKVWKDKIEFISKYVPRNNKKTILDNCFNDKVALLKVYPGQDPSILDFYALKYKGLILEGTGMGHLPAGQAENSWMSKLRKHIKAGLIVCMTSQCINGRVDPYVYASGREILDAGVIYLEDMLSETALVKLGWLLGHKDGVRNIKMKMLNSLAGELNNCLSN